MWKTIYYLDCNYNRLHTVVADELAFQTKALLNVVGLNRVQTSHDLEFTEGLACKSHELANL